MVKALRLTLISLLVFSCSGKKNADDHVAFDSEAYAMDNYTGRILNFLESRPETKEQTGYKAVFINTENCSACMRSAFMGIEPFLSKSRTKIFIYANDSSLESLVPKNDNLRFICLPPATFHEKDIFHTELYMYTIRNKRISSTYLDLPTSDSLNKL